MRTFSITDGGSVAEEDVLPEKRARRESQLHESGRRLGWNPYVHYNPVNRVDTNHFFDCLMDRLLEAGLIVRRP